MSISHQGWGQLLKSLNEERNVTTPLNHPTLTVRAQLFHVGNINITSIHLLYEMAFRSRRIWIGISDPNSPCRKQTDELRSSSEEAWRIILSSTSLVYSMLLRPTLECWAAADAMASDTIVGIGGYIILPSGISGWFQLQLHPSDSQVIAPWATAQLQRNVCAFELLGQCLLWNSHQNC